MEDTSRLKCLCSVLGLDLKQILRDQVDQSVDNIDIWVEAGLSEETTNRLASAVHNLSKIKSERFIQLKQMASRMILYWSALSTHLQEKREFLCILHYAEVESEAEITEYHALSVDSIQAVERELGRLEKKMDDLISKKKAKLDQIFQSTRLKRTSAVTGPSDSYAAFEQVKLHISEAKACSSQRKDIVTRVELLQSANKEIIWYHNSNVSIEDRRVDRARVLVQLFPKMLRDLKDKANSWMLKDGGAFLFDGIDVSKIASKMETDYEGLVGSSSLGKVNPMDIEEEAVDIFQLAIPRKPRTKTEEVVLPLPPPPPHQVMSDGDDSMASDGNGSDPNDPDYKPGDSNGNGSDPNDPDYKAGDSNESG